MICQAKVWSQVVAKVRIRFLVAASVWAMVCPPALGEPDAQEAGSAFDVKRVSAGVIDKALLFLQRSQQPDGGWPGMEQTSDPAITALVTKCFIQHGRYGPQHPLVERALKFMLTYAKDDGGIYVDGSGLRNYQTSVCLMALAATRDPKYARRIGAAQEFLIDLQWDGAEGYEPDSPWFGGADYGRHKRPDLSNTQMMIEALHESGLPPDHPVYKRALVFIQRCQMRSLSNDQAFAAGSGDGGFIYTPVAGGQSKAGQETVDGKKQLRSYGSMTYAGFKSLLYADLGPDDPPVKAALDWIRGHYTLEHNPNMPEAQSLQGLYYYYHLFAKAFAAWGQQHITDSAGTIHPWAAELCQALQKRQRTDGSFVNPADRWMEGNPYLVTAYAVLALQAAATDG